MPIISDISSGFNVIINLLRLLIEKPHLLLIFILAILFFPLNALDYILSITVNIFILLINILLFVIIIPVNIILTIISNSITFLIQIIATPINWLLALVNMSWAPPTFPVAGITPPFLSWVSINWFGANDTVIGIIISNLGLSFPLFSIKPIAIQTGV